MSEFSLPDMYRMHWAQPIEQQTRDAIAGMTDEQRTLETWLNDEVACESGHTNPGNKVCSVEVTHLVVGHLETRVCTAHAEAKTRDMGDGFLCNTCGRLADTCWSIRPI